MKVKIPDTILTQSLQACKQAFIVAGVFSFFLNIFVLTVPIYTLELYDRVLISHSADTLIYLTLLGVGILLLYGLIDAARAWIMVAVSTWLDRKITKEMLAQSSDTLIHGNQYPLQAPKDIQLVRGFISSPGLFVLFDAPWLPIFIVVLFFLHPLLGVTAILSALLLFGLAILNIAVTKNDANRIMQAEVNSQLQLNSTLRTAESVQAMGMIPAITFRWFNSTANIVNTHSKMNRRSQFILSTSKFARLAVQIIMLAIGAYLVIQEQLTAGMMIAASILLARALAPVEQSISVWSQMRSAKEAYQRLQIYFSQPPLRHNNRGLMRPKGQLQVDQVQLILPRMEKPLLKAVHFALQAGELLAIVGPSGSGKTTLARLLVGNLKPSHGAIRLDGADIFHWARDEVGVYLGYLSQDIELLPGTVKENIARMQVPDDKLLLQAAELAGSHQTILHLPQGYDTDVSTCRLSGGQKQLIALTRALYSEPAFLVLDEPTSNLDAALQEHFIQMLTQLRKQKVTTIVITHLPVLLNLVDKILVLRDGQQQAFGPPSEIIRKQQPKPLE